MLKWFQNYVPENLFSIISLLYILNSNGFLILSSNPTRQGIISGAGTANVTAVDKLHVEISGAATVKYKGTAKVSEDISGVGSVTHVN
jgi:hypothetical protein